MLNIFSRKKEPIPLWFNTDIHCHVIPGVDDGSPDPLTSAILVENMQRWGINRIIASPHVTQDVFENTPEKLDAAMELLKNELKTRGNNIDLSHSAEYRMDDFFLKQIENNNLRPYPNGYLLVEGSWIAEIPGIDQLLFDLRIKGFQPILAHPERYLYYHRHPERYRKLHDAGTMFQINVLSLSGYYGKEIRKVADQLIDAGMVDFLGTDLHGMRHVESIDNYLCTRDARRHRDALEGKILNDTL